jgi:hypothetical protein
VHLAVFPAAVFLYRYVAIARIGARRGPRPAEDLHDSACPAPAQNRQIDAAGTKLQSGCCPHFVASPVLHFSKIRKASPPCGWCGATVRQTQPGRQRRWCSDSCRMKSYPACRALAFGRRGLTDRSPSMRTRISNFLIGAHIPAEPSFDVIDELSCKQYAFIERAAQQHGDRLVGFANAKRHVHRGALDLA